MPDAKLQHYYPAMDAEEAEAAAFAMAPRYKLVYVVPHPWQNLSDASKFSGYTPGLLGTAALRPRCRQTFMSSTLSLRFLSRTGSQDTSGHR